jgi:hypothetical protein
MQEPLDAFRDTVFAGLESISTIPEEQNSPRAFPGRDCAGRRTQRGMVLHNSGADTNIIKRVPAWT